MSGTMQLLFTILLIIFVIDIIILIPVILMQSGSGAQSGVFGSDITMGAFGAKTSEVLVKFTKWLIGIFFVVAFLMTYISVGEMRGFKERPQGEVTGSQPSGETTGAVDTNASTNMESAPVDTNIPATSAPAAIPNTTPMIPNTMSSNLLPR